MTTVITQLSKYLLHDIKTADEIWIAVALIKNDGWKLIHNQLSKECKLNFLIGLNLPTNPEVLIDLNNLQLSTNNVNVRLYIDNKKNFHPKFYLIRKGNNYSAYVGSANCTNGGLNNNVELSTNITNKAECENLLEWFNSCFNQGTVLRTKFIEKYQADFKERLEMKKRDDSIVNRLKQNLNEDLQVSLSNEIGFIRILKKYRSKPVYNNIVKRRDGNIKELNEALDYPSFNNIDIEKYFSYPELGHLIAIAKPAIKRNINELKQLLDWLIDENIDIAVRYDRAIGGNLKVEGISTGTVSKFLISHRPDLYFVQNDPSENALKKYGFKLKRGLSEGEKYKKTCEYLRNICEQTDIKDLAVLDYYLYLEGNKE